MRRYATIIAIACAGLVHGCSYPVDSSKGVRMFDHPMANRPPARNSNLLFNPTPGAVDPTSFVRREWPSTPRRWTVTSEEVRWRETIRDYQGGDHHGHRGHDRYFSQRPSRPRPRRSMRFECTAAGYPSAECRRLVVFASYGIDKKGVSVCLKGRDDSFSGMAWPRWPRRILLKMGPKSTLRPVIPRTKTLKRMYPTIPIRGWRDVLVFLAAHEFFHLFQFQYGLPAGEQGAEEHAIRMLDEWRRETGRKAIRPICS